MQQIERKKKKEEDRETERQQRKQKDKRHTRDIKNARVVLRRRAVNSSR